MKANQAREQALEVLKGTRKFEKQFAHANKMIKGMVNRGQFSVRFTVFSSESARSLAEALTAKLKQDGYNCDTEYLDGVTAQAAKQTEKGKVVVKVSSV